MTGRGDEALAAREHDLPAAAAPTPATTATARSTCVTATDLQTSKRIKLPGSTKRKLLGGSCLATLNSAVHTTGRG
jgi:hypothetical protein